jgi:hypothetical protein
MKMHEVAHWCFNNPHMQGFFVLFISLEKRPDTPPKIAVFMGCGECHTHGGFL